MMNSFQGPSRKPSERIMACLLYAHMQNSNKPGTFNDEVNKVFKLNNLPSIILPNNPPSVEILNLPATSTTTSHESLQSQNTATNNIETHIVEETTHASEDTLPPPTQMQGTQLGVQIITKRSVGWPKGELKIRNIIDGIESGKYKWRYTSTAYEEEEIYNYMRNNDIDLSNCFCNIDDTQFRKIRNGLLIEKTPPPSTQGSRHRSK